jgi:L-cysteine desulfidase
MDKNIYKQYVNVLNEELLAALGCTEPIAIAYASAVARKTLGAFPQKMTAYCSGNIIKNVKAVTVPNSGGQKGVEAAAILGMLGGDPDKKLEVLSAITPDQIEQSRRMVSEGLCEVKLVEGVANLYIRMELFAGVDTAKVEIIDKHTNIVAIERNGIKLMDRKYHLDTGSSNHKRDFMSIEGILDFVDTLDINDVKKLLDEQVKCNLAIADEGLKNSYGANVGKNMLRLNGNDVVTRAKAYAAAGSDARMSGCDLAVVINSGSGNQGIAVSVPVVEFARELKVSDDRLYRALTLSNLVAVHLKSGIGSLSAFCGAVSAATGSGAAISYLHGGTRHQIENTIINTLGTVSGIICDGAKPSCAAKVAAAVDAAILADEMSFNDDYFKEGEGIITGDIEATIQNIGRLGRVGMKDTDVEILNMMIGQ